MHRPRSKTSENARAVTYGLIKYALPSLGRVKKKCLRPACRQRLFVFVAPYSTIRVSNLMCRIVELADRVVGHQFRSTHSCIEGVLESSAVGCRGKTPCRDGGRSPRRGLRGWTLHERTEPFAVGLSYQSLMLRRVLADESKHPSGFERQPRGVSQLFSTSGCCIPTSLGTWCRGRT